MVLLATVVYLAAEEAAHQAGEVSSGGLSAIGLDPKALLFQLINFAILFWVLKRVAYRPIINVLEARRSRIEESLRTAHEIEQREKHLAERQTQMIHQAREEAGDIVARARMQSAELLEQADVKARKQADKVMAEARGRIDQEVEVARTALKREMSGLVAAATEAVLDEKVDEVKDKSIIERSLAKVNR